MIDSNNLSGDRFKDEFENADFLFLTYIIINKRLHALTYYFAIILRFNVPLFSLKYHRETGAMGLGLNYS